jgi:hypothetical protein
VLTVLAWYWKQPEGRTSYEPLHIEIWRDMVRRNLSMPHRIACVTNEDIRIDGVEIIRPPSELEQARIPSWPAHRPQCLRRLVMFRPDAAQWFGERFVCMDLDAVISAPLDPMFDVPDDFRMAYGTAAGRPYNGSLMLMTAGARPQVYTEFSEAGATRAGRRFVGSDQAWIADILGPNEAKWQESDGLVYHGLGRSPSTKRRLTFFPGAKKPWQLTTDPFIGHHYRKWNTGRCLVLGYEETLWADVRAALKHGPYDAVIASPEAAEHWRGEILAVARDNNEAARIAALHGFDDVTWCGVTEREAA